MKGILRFLFILFLEVGCGLSLGFLYWLISYIFFRDGDFYHSRLNEAIYYIVILLPPFIYCLFEHLSLKRNGDNTKSTILLAAGITYLLGGFVLLLVSTKFFLLNG